MRALVTSSTFVVLVTLAGRYEERGDVARDRPVGDPEPGEDGGVHYYVMQFIRGQGLDAVLSEIRRLRKRRERIQSPTPSPLYSGERAGVRGSRGRRGRTRVTFHASCTVRLLR